MFCLGDLGGFGPHPDRVFPLLREHGVLAITAAAAIHRCEYGAQAMAVHGGLTARARGERAQPGMLVSLRDVVLACDVVQDLDGELIVEATRVHAGGTAWQYDFRVAHAGRRLAQGRAVVSLASGT